MNHNIAMISSRAFALFTALYWGACGIYFFLHPEAMQHAGYEIKHWAALTEARAMYGGIEIALAMFSFLGFLRPINYLKQMLTLNLLVFGWIGIGRIAGIIQYQGTFQLIWDQPPLGFNSITLWLSDIPMVIFCLIFIYMHERFIGKK